MQRYWKTVWVFALFSDTSDNCLCPTMSLKNGVQAMVSSNKPIVRSNDEPSSSFHNSNSGVKEPWIRTASCVDSDGESQRIVLHKVDSSSSEQSSSRLWLEYCEREVHQGQGIYTVLRADFDQETLDECKVWGLNFHLERLKESNRRLFKILGIEPTIEMEEGAVKKSRNILHEFLRNYHEDTKKKMESSSDKTFRCLSLMIALLWTPFSNQNEVGITVEGHASEISILPRAAPVDVILAISSRKDKLTMLPSRYDREPLAKLSGWCNRRRPLEKMFKLQSMSEVLLCHEVYQNESNTDEDISDYQVLEGLTSNVFVVMDDNSVRTAGNDVLLGYARSLVISAVKELGLSIDERPPLLSEMKEGRWREVFLTSSIRILVPVKRIFLKEEGGNLVQKWTHPGDISTVRNDLLRKIMSVKQSVLIFDDC